MVTYTTLAGSQEPLVGPRLGRRKVGLGPGALVAVTNVQLEDAVGIWNLELGRSLKEGFKLHSHIRNVYST